MWERVNICECNKDIGTFINYSTLQVKTTSPEKYRVRPSSGYVKPGSDVEVVIHLQNGNVLTVKPPVDLAPKL